MAGNEKNYEVESGDASYYSSSGVPQSASGEIRVSNEVIADIAAHACKTVEGFSGFTEGIVDGLSKILQGELSEGIVVHNVSDAYEDSYSVEIDLSIVIKYGHTIQKTASDIQVAVKERIESLTGVYVSRVNINVQGVSFEQGKGE